MVIISGVPIFRIFTVLFFFFFFVEDPSFKTLDQAILKEAFSALVTLVAEATKHDMDPTSIR